MLDRVSTQRVVAERKDRNRTNALFNSSKLKLGLFGVNCNNGCAMTTADEAHWLTWDLTKQIAKTADDAGFEVMVPVARWKGLGGPNNFNGRNFETYTWAAGLAAITKHITLTTTSHVQTTHPIGETGGDDRSHQQRAILSQYRLWVVSPRARNVWGTLSRP
jgi:thymidine kinase